MVPMFLLHAALAAPGGQAYYAAPNVTTEHVVRVRCARCGRIISETSSHAGPFTEYRTPSVYQTPSAPPIQQMSYQQPAQPRVVHYGAPIRYGSPIQYNAPSIRYSAPVRYGTPVQYAQPIQSRPIYRENYGTPSPGRMRSQRPNNLEVQAAPVAASM